MLLADAPAIWLPPAPAIIRPAEDRLLKPSFWPASRDERRAALKELVAKGRITREQARDAFVWFAPTFFGPLDRPASITFGGGLSTKTGTSLSWTGINFGAEDDGRYLVAGFGRVSSSGAAAPTSCTLGGVAATRVGFSSGTNANTMFYIALVPTGTSGTVALVNSGSNVTLGGLWVVYGLKSATPTTAFIYDSSSPYSQSITIPKGGVAFGCTCWSSGKPTTTWSGLVENYDDTSNAQTSGSGASLASAAGATITAAASPSSSPVYGAMGVIAFR